MADKTENISYVARPKGKPDESLKGKLNKWNNGYAEFIPAGSKPSNRTMLKQLGGSSFYKSEGQKLHVPLFFRYHAPYSSQKADAQHVKVLSE